jgi:3'(2'), 5'-bisphosphate nucleotidase
MPDGSPDDDHALAAGLAAQAGAALVALRAELAARGADRWTVMDSGDIAAHRLLMAALAHERPNDAVLSEEGVDNRPARLANRRVWVVDPLDGSHEYGDPGRHEWAVHVALVEDGVVVAAAVSLPAWDQLLTTRPAPPPPPPVGERRLRVITSRWRPAAPAVMVADALDAHLVGLGGAGAKAMAVVLGEADVYTAAGLNEWDAAAPAGVALAAGLHVSRFDGAPVPFNQPDPWVPELLVCRPELADACLTVLGRR